MDFDAVPLRPFEAFQSEHDVQRMDLDGFRDTITSGPSVVSPSVESHDDEDIDDYQGRTSDDSTDKKPSAFSTTNSRIEVAIPEMSQEDCKQYMSARSAIVERVVLELPPNQNEVDYQIEFTDGREEQVSLAELLTIENGELALASFSQSEISRVMSMNGTSRKRKYDDPSGSDLDSSTSDSMILKEDDTADHFNHALRSSTRQLRSRQTAMHSFHRSSLISDDEDDSGAIVKSDVQKEPTRKLRTRSTRQLTLTNMAFRSQVDDPDEDELLHDPSRVSSDGDDAEFVYVTSDIQPKMGRSSRANQRSRRLQATRLAQSRARSLRTAQRNSTDSDIEFEAPRRSARSTRNTMSMRDDINEDSFYAVNDKTPNIPKVISIREVFQQLPSASAFASMHMETCHTCSGSRQRGQLIYCQGCTLSYHKNCLGYRSAREHMVTKVGEDNFVLQCRFCVGVYKKKDLNAPSHSSCQTCKSDGRACAAFSVRKTARQEEKLREQNGGVDPITPVAADLLNNSDNVLFRCTGCHRGWHTEHLPSAYKDLVGSDVKSERFKDYSVDWQCNDCSSAKYKIHQLVAWRRKGDTPEISHQLTYDQVQEDDKEYLVKWESLSYAHCTWKPGAWIFGVAAAAMRTSFGKRDAELDLMRFSEKEAIPIEYMTPDIILNVKLHNSARLGSKDAMLSSIGLVSKIFVKFQGLGYDDVVWDSPPKESMGSVYDAFVNAYREYIEGKYFQIDTPQKIRERIKAFKSKSFVELDEQPTGLKRGKLMGYQVEGLNWLLGNYHSGRSVVLADEMGLGKTIQVVSLVTSLVQDKPKCWPFLIAVPNATCANWRREFKQWAPGLRVVTYHGGKEPQDLAYKYELFPDDSKDMKAHVVIMSYDSAADPRTRVLFKSVNWAGLVVDEGQRLKNDQNLLYQALRAMRIPFRLLLTGTPLQNNKRELFNLIQFIDSSHDAEQLDEEFDVLDKETLPKLHEKIRPYFLRRTKAGVLKFLPPMSQIILPVTMTIIQEKLSKSIMAKSPELINAIFANSKMNRKERGSLNNILMQLRKCLCHPFMYSEAIEEKHHDPVVLHRNLVEASSKLLLLEQMLPRLKERGHRVLLFSQFLQQLDIIEDFLMGLGYEYRRLDGSIGSLEKQRRIDDFNAPNSSVFAFLLSTRAGGVGINLATADTVIILDPDFNPHQDMQALSRAHRIGQKKKVLCFQIVTKDSVEERVMQVGRKKMALDHALIESMDDDELAGDDLESILKHGAQALFDENYEKTAIQYDAAAIDKLLDRTLEEEPKMEVTTGENQFSYARVWANEKSGFDTLAPEEENEPVPLNSSVWDRILAEREEEARKLAEANREVLGRGGRRRGAINYNLKANDTTAQILGDQDGHSSDSSEDFADGANSVDESEDEQNPTSAKETAKDVEFDRKEGEPDTTKAWKTSTIVRVNAQENGGSSDPTSSTAANSNSKGKGRGRKAKQSKGPLLAYRGPAESASSEQQSGTNTGASWDDIKQYIKPHYQKQIGERQKSTLLPEPEQQTELQDPATFVKAFDLETIHLVSEAEVRLAMDYVRHSGSNSEAIKLQTAILLRKLMALRKEKRR
ncbi:PHD/FYVE-zinc-finger like domain-containing protein [Mariannaea sp. PMI_226]|nr:PHD/FYVE-zinc-finger like domain-containing protein [Mariannaea sp. PMI_226]